MVMTSARNLLTTMLAGMLLTACIGGPTPQSRYYLLSSSGDLAPTQATRSSEALSVSVGPVIVPAHLDRLEIVTKPSRHRLELAEFDLWAEPLDENIARILVENLSRLLGTDEVFRYEEKRGAPVDMEVAVDVERMEARASAKTELIVRWTLIRAKERDHLFTRRSRYVAKLNGPGFEALAAGMSRNIAELSVEIATAIAHFTK
jgi:uncharacterized protein